MAVDSYRLGPSVAAAVEARPTTSTRTVVNTFGGLILVLFLLATTRWGSYILPGPPYLADIGLGVLVVDRLLMLPVAGRSFPAVDTWAGLAVAALLLVTFVAICLGPLNVEAFRDAVPYLYGLFVFLAPPLPAAEIPRARKLITAFLGFHLAWTTLALVDPSLETRWVTPGSPTVDFLSTRADIDGLVNGLAASLGLYRLMRGERGVVFFVWGLTLVLVSHSRISLPATVLTLGLAVFYVVAQSGREATTGRLAKIAGDASRMVRGRPRPLVAVVASLVVLAIVGLVVAPTSFDRLEHTFGGGSSSISVEKGAQASGTTTARLRAWSRMVDWVTSSDSRDALGAGFGSNIMLQSGAGVALTATVDPSLRAPHNFLLGTWAHLGMIGLVIMLVIFLRGFVLAVAARRWPLTEVDVLAALLVVGMPVIAVAGVVMESPFGAVPFFWALGYLGSVGRTYAAARPAQR